MNATAHNPIAAPGRRNTAGFSLIELILVLSIISILAGIAMPRYAGALARYRADAAARRVIADLEYARQRARASSTSITVCFKAGQNCILFDGVPSMDNPDLQWETKIAGAPYHAELKSVSFSGSKLIFDGYGVPDSGGTLVLTVGTESRTVVLDVDTGKAVVQ